MVDKRIAVFFGIIVLLIGISFIAAADGYCFKKLRNGQSVPAAITSTTSHLVCDGTKCTVRGLKTDDSFLQVCTDSNGYYASYIMCDSICSGNGDGGQEAPLTLNVIFPFSDGGVYTKQTFFMNIHTNKVASISLVDNVNDKMRNLCPNCVDYEKSMTFNKGFNNITIRAVRKTEFQEYSISFFIDNQKPRITKTYPLANKYAKGNFSVTYDEDNIKQVKLYYGSQSNPNIIELTGCSSGKAQACSTIVDLGSAGKEIYYWFSVSDIAGNEVKSKATKVYVDNTAPVLDNFNYSISKTYVTFNMKIIENNFDKAVYYDNTDTKPKTLCSGLKNGICSNKVSFKSGHHSVSIVISDKAGNLISKEIDFDI